MNVGLVGYGKMGAGIFRLLAGRDFGTVVHGRDQNKCCEHAERYFKSLERAVKRGRLAPDEYDAKLRSIKFTADYADLAHCDLVIESAVEDQATKLEIFRRLEDVTRPDAALVTNTSSLSISQMAAHLVHPERFCGLHFFYPVPLIDLVEIIRTDSAPSQLIERLRALAAALGRKSITVKDAPGSMINAILGYYYIESLYVLEEGKMGPSAIDRLAKRFFYVGPCESMDMIGTDFLVDALKRSATPGSICPLRWDLNPDGSVMAETAASADSFFAPALLTRLLAAGRLGRKTGRGIYLYQNEKPHDDELGFYHSPKAPYLAPRWQTEEMISLRLLHAVLNGSLQCLAKGMASAEDIDIGVREILQMKDGPFTLMETMGDAKFERRCKELTAIAGERFQPHHLPPTHFHP